MQNKGLLYLLIGAGILAALATGGVVGVAMWKQSARASKWLPALRAAEVAHGIPTDLLARIAYQESSWRPEVIDGTVSSGPGALGLMQLMPQYFSSVRVPVPFTDGDTAAQIEQAATELARLYRVFGDWQLAVAAYDWGQGDVSDYLAGTKDMPTETQNYVAHVFSDVPVPGSLV